MYIEGGKSVKSWQFSNCSLPINAMKTSWERTYLCLKTRCDWSNCYVTYFYFLVRPYQFVVFYLFLLKIKEKSHKLSCHRDLVFYEQNLKSCRIPTLINIKTQLHLEGTHNLAALNAEHVLEKSPKPLAGFCSWVGRERNKRVYSIFGKGDKG